MKKITLEKYLYLKGYTTEKTATIRIKANIGVAKAFKELLFENLEKGDILKLQHLANEFKEFYKIDRKKVHKKL